MAAYYLDTSALVKRYARERGTAWITALTTPTAGHELYTLRLTGPEMIAALERKARTGQITRADAQRVMTTFRLDWQAQYQSVEVTAAVADRSMDLAQQHGRRGFDATHLSAALAIHTLRVSLRRSPLVFISADTAQLQAAATEGLAIDDPNQHP